MPRIRSVWQVKKGCHPERRREISSWDVSRAHGCASLRSYINTYRITHSFAQEDFLPAIGNFRTSPGQFDILLPEAVESILMPSRMAPHVMAESATLKAGQWALPM